MDDLGGGVAGGAEAVLDLQVATGIRSGDDARARRAEVAELALLEPRGGGRLREVVDAGAAAAPGGLGAFAQLDAGERAENRAGLGGDFLAVAEMAGVVISREQGSRLITNVQHRTPNIQRRSVGGF